MSITHKVPDTTVHGQRGTGRKYETPLSASIITGTWIAIECLAILVVGLVTFSLLIKWGAHVQEYYFSAICFFTVTSFLLAHFAGLYSFGAIIRPVEVADRLVVVFITSFLLLLAVAFSLKVSEIFSRIWMYTFAASACITVVTLRFAGSFAVRRLAEKGVFVRNIAILGGGEQGHRFLAHIGQTQLNFVNVVGVFDDRRDRVGPEVEGHPVLGTLSDLIGYAREARIDDVVVALPWSADERLRAIVGQLRELPVNIYLASDLAGFTFSCREAPGHFERAPIVEVLDTPLSGWKSVLKALEDRILAVLIIIAFLPLMALVALAIKLEDPAGPIFFKQKRYGFNNKPFSIYKFRSMFHNRPPEKVTKQAVKDDPRITRVGKFIRRTSLDEFPQLLNVLNGTMSLVGPRPHAVDHNEEYSKKIGGYFARHRVKPGMTGWAQVNGWRGETDTLDKMEARVQHDIYYAEHWSVLFDLKILLMTAYVVILGKNAY